MVDRRHAPGGHWLEAYPFVRLHQPSAYYGVNSRPLGSEAIDRHGLDWLRGTLNGLQADAMWARSRTSQSGSTPRG